jgi:NAD(P)-dependent dehydrogenase (short-subunit alcohol dehydrogenase family)
MRLEGKVALITGGASGIGAETARLFAREGASVSIGDMDEQGAIDVARAIDASGGSALAVRLDVTEAEEVEAAVAKTVDQFGHLDILFNCAGIFIEGGALDHTEEDWDKVMDVNVKGTFLACKYAMPVMLEAGGGAIVNVGSIQSFSGDSASLVYTASKAAILTLTRNIALKFAARGIRCNTVCPGDCETPLIQALFDENPGMREAIAAKYPAGRLAKPIDIANAVLFLASDEAGFANGTELVIDGGFLAK